MTSDKTQQPKTYDDDQLKAIEAHDGYFLVLAPPGCGKTDILAERIARAREQGVEFSDMLCLTFTNRAARGMRNRICERVGEDSSEVFVGNIHRFCSGYIFSNGVIPENASIFDDEDQEQLMCSFSLSYFTRLIPQTQQRIVNKEAVDRVLNLASYIKQSQYGHDEELKPSDKKYSDTPSNKKFKYLYNLALQQNFDIASIPTDQEGLIYALKYLQFKKERGVIDFDDILIEAYEHLRHNDERKRYPWIQIDEVQDLNPLQLAVADLLTADNPTVMYLGDEQQAIFSFMGAKLSQLDLLKNRCKGNIMTLGFNYRAPKYLLDICNDFAEKQLKVDPVLLPKCTNVKPKDKFDVILTSSTDLQAEDARIRGMVDFYLKQDDQERLAIIVTKNNDADLISEELTKNNIPNFKISGLDMFKSKTFKTVSAFYCVLANDFNSAAWARLLYGLGANQTLMQASEFVSRLRSLMMTPSDLFTEKTYLERFRECYDNQTMVFFDTETTGLNVREDDIVQIAAFKVCKGQKVDGSDFNILLHTDREIPEKLGDIVNPLRELYANSEHFSREVGLRMFLDYIGDCPLLGHNVMYDYLILQSNVERALNEQVQYEVFDSLHIIKCVEPNLRRYKLEFLLDELNLRGKNSHLANEDIEATKSLVDYCCAKFLPILPQQQVFKNTPRAKYVLSKINVLGSLFDDIRSYMYYPIDHTRRSLADELKDMHRFFVDKFLLKDIGPKYDVFLRYVESEWVEPNPEQSLYEQIYNHVYDITGTINEGDLINSQDLIQDRVFIMTVYKGKGLEFDNVVVLRASDGVYPFWTTAKKLKSFDEKIKAQGEIENMEEARKFYVAISRAKKRLCVSYTLLSPAGYPTRMTPFMDHIKHHFYQGRKGSS